MTTESLPLENGDHLSRAEFERRCRATPSNDNWSLVTDNWSLVTDNWSLITGH
jgi:hypothetical protein